MLQKTKRFMEDQMNITSVCRIVIGLSGGMDSVCLFHLLHTLGYPLEAVHVHHGIRGEEADRDAAFVRRLCEQYSVRLHEFFYDVPDIAGKKHLSVEEAGRLVRRESFSRVLQDMDSSYIALAHHAADRAETLLFHLSRGTGLKGLVAMKAADGLYIRPLLWASREEIAHYVKEQGLSFVEDSTNAQDCYARNRIRHQVLPQLAQINSKAAEHIAGTARKLEALADYVDREAEKYFQNCTVLRENELLLLTEAFSGCDEVLRIPVLQKCTEYLSDSGKDFTEKHFLMLQKLMNQQTGKEISLPYGLTAVKVYDGIRLFYKAETKKTDPVEISGEGRFEFSGETFEIFVENWERGKIFPTNNYTKCFDYDKIKSKILLRGREKGDYLTINRDGGRKSLQDYLVNEKVPKDQRDEIILLADGNHVMWVVGKRISEHYKVTEDTAKVLKVHLIGGNEDGL
ncbi:MAG: tRNA lysidine(34) synthetase TilS [Lachnospiraceae bacterium]